jgi:dolichol kinase
MVAVVIMIFFFPKPIAIIGLSVLFISDVLAAIIGRKFGKKRFLGLKNKSLVGSSVFVITAMIISTI